MSGAAGLTATAVQVIVIYTSVGTCRNAPVGKLHKAVRDALLCTHVHVDAVDGAFIQAAAVAALCRSSITGGPPPHAPFNCFVALPMVPINPGLSALNRCIALAGSGPAPTPEALLRHLIPQACTGGMRKKLEILLDELPAPEEASAQGTPAQPPAADPRVSYPSSTADGPDHTAASPNGRLAATMAKEQSPAVVPTLTPPGQVAACVARFEPPKPVEVPEARTGAGSGGLPPPVSGREAAQTSTHAAAPTAAGKPAPGADAVGAHANNADAVPSVNDGSHNTAPAQWEGDPTSPEWAYDLQASILQLTCCCLLQCLFALMQAWAANAPHALMSSPGLRKHQLSIALLSTYISATHNFCN